MKKQNYRKNTKKKCEEKEKKQKKAKIRKRSNKILR